MMTIRIYNTLGGKKQQFEPINPGKVGMYVCGPTVYDSCHIGHARSVVVFDVIARYFRKRGYDVTYVRNFTDVDDKIINKANELGIDSMAVAEKYIEEFYEDMDALGVKRADWEPRVTQFIQPIIELVQVLIDNDMAYAVDGDVYYAVETFADYGKLSGRKLEEMEAGARVEVDHRKRNPFDFALWKSSKPGEPAWDSPWGKGRPGWHIECSAMSWKHLGKSFDIHGGGKDLIFPHHENELAQSEGAFHQPFAKYWMHNGFVNINQEKMSKSLGNFLMIKDVLKSYHPETVRLFLLSNHYRSPIDFSNQAMDEANVRMDRIYTFIERADKSLELPKSTDTPNGEYWERFCQAMDDDFNTALGIGVLFEAIRHLNALLDKDAVGAEEKEKLHQGLKDIAGMGEILGIARETPAAYFEKKKNLGLAEDAVDKEKIEGLIQKRTEARKAKDFKTADQIRDQLAQMNIILEDRPDGTIWKIQ